VHTFKYLVHLLLDVVANLVDRGERTLMMNGANGKLWGAAIMMTIPRLRQKNIEHDDSFVRGHGDGGGIGGSELTMEKRGKDDFLPMRALCPCDFLYSLYPHNLINFPTESVELFSLCPHHLININIFFMFSQIPSFHVSHFVVNVTLVYRPSLDIHAGPDSEVGQCACPELNPVPLVY
jgi:hypothetical protein